MFVISNASRRIIQYKSSPLRYDNNLAGLTGCVIFGYIDSMCYAGSSMFVTLVSFERYLAICYPIYHHLVKGKKRTVKMSCAGWIYSMVISLCDVFLYADIIIAYIVWPADHKYNKYPATSVLCVQMSSAFVDAIYVTKFAAWILLPLSNGFMYYKIMKTLNERNGLEPGTSPTENAQSQQVAIMLVANGTVFYCCCMVMLGSVVMTFLQTKDILDLDEFTNIIWYHVFCLIFTLNCCINPIVYCLTNNRYRQIFFDVMKDVIYKT